MTLDAFLCASPLLPNDTTGDVSLHVEYLAAQAGTYPDWARLTVIQNGCGFPTNGVRYIRHPFPKNIAYNWLVCDANCDADYWLFLPEDCRISAHGWAEIEKHMAKGKPCFGLAKDPKALVGRRGIFEGLSADLQAVCDMNLLGKEIAGAVLRGELDRLGFHCISPNWARISDRPRRFGNELYEEINTERHPYDINKPRALPSWGDYGIDVFRASPAEMEAAFLTMVDSALARQRAAAEATKGVISRYTPLITKLPYKGAINELWDRWRRSS